MEFGVRQFRLHEQFHGIPCKAMDLGVRQFSWHEKYVEAKTNPYRLIQKYLLICCVTNIRATL